MSFTYEDVLEYIDLSSKKILEGEVLKAVSEEMLGVIEEDVYSYNPTTYNRRTTGGLRDPSNIVLEMIDANTGVVKNVATPNDSVLGTKLRLSSSNDTTFASWINDGSVPNIFNSKTYPWHKSGFLEKTISNLEKTNGVEKAVEKGLQDIGFSKIEKR